MKAVIFTALILSITACSKKTMDITVNGKLVHRSCASIVVQITDSTAYNLGENNWQQAPGKPTYNHVFSVANTCAFPSAKEGDKLAFKVINEDPGMKDCVICMMFDNPPTKRHIIKVISANPY